MLLGYLIAKLLSDFSDFKDFLQLLTLSQSSRIIARNEVFRQFLRLQNWNYWLLISSFFAKVFGTCRSLQELKETSRTSGLLSFFYQKIYLLRSRNDSKNMKILRSFSFKLVNSRALNFLNFTLGNRHFSSFKLLSEKLLGIPKMILKS